MSTASAITGNPVNLQPLIEPLSEDDALKEILGSLVVSSRPRYGKRSIDQASAADWERDRRSKIRNVAEKMSLPIGYMNSVQEPETENVSGTSAEELSMNKRYHLCRSCLLMEGKGSIAKHLVNY